MHAALFAGRVDLFIRVRIKERSTELGRGLPKDYAAVSDRGTCLGRACANISHQTKA